MGLFLFFPERQCYAKPRMPISYARLAFAFGVVTVVFTVFQDYFSQDTLIKEIDDESTSWQSIMM